MDTLSGWFEKLVCCGGKPAVITVIGTGGKTSLVWLLARRLSRGPERGARRRVLVSPSTKMFLPDAGQVVVDRYCAGPPAAPVAGVTLAGIPCEKAGKLEALPPAELARIAPAYDLVLVEGDGSRGRPLKGWADYEPVVPPFTTLTVGMIPLWPLGRPVTEETVHRLPLFCALSGASPGEAVTMDHLAAVIGGKAGGQTAGKSLFSAARGNTVLLFNQIEDAAAVDRARELVSRLPAACCSGLSAIIAGSVRQDAVWEMAPR